MASFEDGFSNEFFDFDNTDNFLNTISGVVNPNGNDLTGETRYDEKSFDKMLLNPGFNPSYDPGANFESDSGAINGPFDNNDSDVNANVNYNVNSSNSQYGDYFQSGSANEYSGNLSGTESNAFQTSSMSSQNGSVGLTPLSQPSLSSTNTSPEPNASEMIKKKQTFSDMKLQSSESEDEVLKGTSGTLKTNSKVTKPKRDKLSHNMIEKKYRTNINSKILMLRDAVPALKIASGSSDLTVTDLEGLTPALKLNKASVLTKATEYIHHLEKKNEILRQQNLHLQKLIQEANLNPQRFQQPQLERQCLPQQQYPPQIAPQQQQQQANQFNSLDYSSAPELDFLSSPDLQPQQNKPNKYLLGGMAAVMGTSLFGGGDSDFKGLSAVPFMPYYFIHPSPIVVQLWQLLKLLLFVGCVGNLILPSLFESVNGVNKNKKLGVNDGSNLLITWVLVSLGIKLPAKIDESRKSEIIQTLLGKRYLNGVSVLVDYMYLSSCEPNFETCVLNLLMGRIIQQKYPIVGKFLNVNMTLKSSLVMNLDYKGEDQSLGKLSKMIKELDGISLFKSELLLARLTNLMLKKNLNNGINDDSNYLKYVEIYKQLENNLYRLMMSWRIMEIINELTESYLCNLLMAEEEEKLKKNSKLLEDVKLINHLLVDDQDLVESLEIYKIFKNFKTVLLPKSNALELMVSMKNNINDTINKFKFLMEGQQLTDDESIEMSESEIEGENSEEREADVKTNRSNKSDSEQATEVIVQNKPVAHIKKHKKLIESLSVVNEEQFLILNCALIHYYYHQNHQEEAFKLLKHFRFENDKVPLSLLSFTALFKVVELLITKDNEGKDYTDSFNEQLEKLIRITRLWLNDNKNFMTDELRGSIADVLVSKGMMLNGYSDIEED